MTLTYVGGNTCDHDNDDLGQTENCEVPFQGLIYFFVLFLFYFCFIFFLFLFYFFDNSLIIITYFFCKII